MKTVELFDSANVRVIDSTSNKPIRCKTEDGLFYTKFRDACLSFPDGTGQLRALVNEFIAAEIAVLMDLPVPEAAIVHCSTPFSVMIDGEPVHISPSYNFGSKAIDSPVVLSLQTVEQLRNIDNPDDALPIMLFDAILHNVDRDGNSGNTLVGGGKPSHLFIIDHGRLFGASEVWNRYSLPNDQFGQIALDPMESNGIYAKLMEAFDLKSQVDGARAKVSRVTEEKLASIISSVPHEWGLSKEDADALLVYLTKRFGNSEEYIRLILKGGAR